MTVHWLLMPVGTEPGIPLWEEGSLVGELLILQLGDEVMEVPALPWSMELAAGLSPTGFVHLWRYQPVCKFKLPPSASKACIASSFP